MHSLIHWLITSGSLLALVVTASMLLCWANEGSHWNWVARVFDPLLVGPAWYLVSEARARATPKLM